MILFGATPLFSFRNSSKCGMELFKEEYNYMGKWDGKMKHLVNLAAEDFVQWLVRDAHFDGELSTNFASRDLDGDVLWQIRISQMPTLLHLEFQAGPDPTMARRIWEYNTEASIKYEQPVKSVVIYLKTSGSPNAEPPY